MVASQGRSRCAGATLLTATVSPVTSWPQHRLLGVDAARGVALLGMVAVHIVSPVGADGQVSPAFLVAAGRSSALFAVIAGVGLALITRWTPATSARRRARDRVAIATRSVLLIGIGLWLGTFDSGVAVILVYYGVLFLLALPFLGLSSRALAAWSAGTMVVAPVLSHLLRPVLPLPSYDVPTLEFFEGSLLDALSELTLTGYYPALPWMAYLFAGLAIGKLPLSSPAVAQRLAVGGLSIWFVAAASSWVLLNPLGGLDALRAQSPELFGRTLETALAVGLYGTTPEGSWWWLAVAAPHTATPFDLAATIGSSMAVLGLFLLILDRPRVWAVPLVSVGGMTLSLYTLHVVMLEEWLPRTMAHAYLWHVVVLTVLAVLWRRYIGQGPLEFLTQRASRSVSRLVVPLSRDTPQARLGP